VRGTLVIKHEFSRNPWKIYLYFLRAKTKEICLKARFELKKKKYLCKAVKKILPEIYKQTQR